MNRIWNNEYFVTLENKIKTAYSTMVIAQIPFHQKDVFVSKHGICFQSYLPSRGIDK